MRTRIRTMLSLAAPLALFGTACATANTPNELTAARSAYEEASKGPAAQYQPADLHEAKKALERAEEIYDDDGPTADAKHFAYIAERKALRAQALGDASAAKTQAMQANEEQRRLQTQALKKSEAQAKASQEALAQERLRIERQQMALDDSKRRLEEAGQKYQMSQSELAAQRAALDKAQSDLDAQRASMMAMQVELEKERKAREEAEKKAQEAAAELAKSMDVKQDARGIVITLPGNVFFDFGKADLLPNARQALDRVADTLSTLPDRSYVIEGHTDNIGSDADNQRLSERRAKAVRDYLVSKGIDDSRIQSVGKGESSPVATNDNPEGRATNRRVEIVVMRPPEAAAPQTGGGPAAKPDEKKPDEKKPGGESEKKQQSPEGQPKGGGPQLDDDNPYLDESAPQEESP